MTINSAKGSISLRILCRQHTTTLTFPSLLFFRPAPSDKLMFKEVTFQTTDPDHDFLGDVVGVVTDLLAISTPGFITPMLASIHNAHLQTFTLDLIGEVHLVMHPARVHGNGDTHLLANIHGRVIVDHSLRDHIHVRALVGLILGLLNFYLCAIWLPHDGWYPEGFLKANQSAQEFGVLVFSHWTDIYTAVD